MPIMSATAVGGYLQELVKKRPGLTSTAVHAAAGVAPNYLWRLEHGEVGDPSAEIIARLVQATGGLMEDIQRLLLNPDATAQEGRDVAYRRILLSSGDEQQVRAALEAIPADQREGFQQVLAELTPEQVEEWLRYGRFLGRDVKPERN